MPLQEGVAFALEVAVKAGQKRDGGEGIFAYEAQYLCADTGYERIEGFNKNIIQVSHPIV